MLGIAKVVGSSMLPTYSDGDFVVIARPLFRSYRVGDVIAVKHPVFGGIIKRITLCAEDGTYLIAGDNLLVSTSTSKMGKISLDIILGRVIYTIRQN